MTNSVYWTEIDNDGYERKVREYNNDGCGEIVFYDEGAGRFIEFNTGEIHNCKLYKKNTSQSRPPQQQQQTSRPPQQNQQPHNPKLEEYSQIQVEELKRQTDIQKGQKENIELLAQYLKTISIQIKMIDEKLATKSRDIAIMESELQYDEVKEDGQGR